MGLAGETSVALALLATCKHNYNWKLISNNNSSGCDSVAR